MPRRNTFPRSVQEQALTRQKNKCACCGTDIACLGEAGRESHRFGEAAHAHHMRHVKNGGSNLVGNCVILCEACHYSVHEGGNYRHGTLDGCEDDFPHFHG